MSQDPSRPPLRHNRHFRFLYASDTISAFGDRLHGLALYILVYNLTGRALDLGLVAIAQILPATLIAPLSGWLVDRVDRRRMMVYMDLIRAGLVLLLPLVDSLPQIMLIGLGLALAEQFHTPARLAILPEMVGREQVVQANAMTMSTAHLLLFVGPAVGGTLIARYGTTAAFHINAATYVVSACLLLGLARMQAPVRDALSTGRQLLRQFGSEVREGAQVLWGDPALRFAIGFFALLTLVSSLQQPITLVFVKEILRQGDDSLGWIIASAGLGGILGGVGAALVRNRVSPLRLVTAACALDGLALIGFANVRNLPAAMALFMAFGLLGAVIQVVVVSLFQTRLPEESRGRALGWLGPVFGPISIGSLGIGTLLADRFGVVAVMMVSGGLQALLGLLALIYLYGQPRLARAGMAGAVLALLAAAVGCAPSRPQRPPDIVLLSVDTLRADHLGAYGGRDVSPFLDSLAASGTRFASAWSPSPWTLPSHATMLTGLHPFQHGAIEQEHRVDDASPRLAQVLRDAGYRTAAAVTSVFVSSRYGLDRGFDSFHDFGIVDGTLDSQANLHAAEVLGHGLEWMQTQSDDRPVFLFLHVFDVHYPYDAPSPFNEQLDPPARPEALQYENYFHYLRNPVPAELMEHLRNQYDEEIAYVDDAFRRFHAAWTARRPDTVFMVVSDHGEEFGERGSWGHAHTLTPEQLHVPWIASGTGVRRQVVEARVGLEDLAPTLAGLAGAVLPRGPGVDRSAQLRTGDVPQQTSVSAQFASTSRFRTLRHRWHAPPLDLVYDLVRNHASLYDLSVDPGAMVDLAPQRRDDLSRALAAMYAWLGEPWELLTEARLTTDGVLMVGGVSQGQQVDAPAGLRFAVFPADAQVTITPADGMARGSFAALGGVRPARDDAVVRYHGVEAEVGRADLTQQDRERLRSLGYID